MHLVAWVPCPPLREGGGWGCFPQNTLVHSSPIHKHIPPRCLLSRCAMFRSTTWFHTPNTVVCASSHTVCFVSSCLWVPSIPVRCPGTPKQPSANSAQRAHSLFWSPRPGNWHTQACATYSPQLCRRTHSWASAAGGSRTFVVCAQQHMKGLKLATNTVWPRLTPDNQQQMDAPIHKAAAPHYAVRHTLGAVCVRQAVMQTLPTSST